MTESYSPPSVEFERRSARNGFGHPLTSLETVMPGPLAASMGADAPWSDLLMMREHQLGREQSVDFGGDRYFAITGTGPAQTLEWHMAGRQTLSVVSRPHLGDVHIGCRETSFSIRCNGRAELLSLTINDKLIPDGHIRFPESDFERIFHVQDVAIRYIMLALRAELEIGCPGGRLYGEALATAVAIHLMRNYSDSARPLLAAKGGLSPAQLRRVTEFIDLHPGNESSLERMAGLVGLSPHHFAYAFKQSVGLPPHRYLLERRITRAKELLKNERLSLA